MKKDRIIKQKILSACEPEKSFEQFCRENNIVPSQPEKKVRGRLAWLVKGVVPALSAAAVVLAIVLPVTLSGNAGGPDNGSTSPSRNVYSDSVTVTEILADTDVSLFNLDYMVDESAAFYKMYADDNKTAENHVGYSVNAKVYGANVTDVPYVYGFTLTTAKSNALAVLDKSVYYGCDSSVSYGGVDYKYNVSVGLSVGMHVYYAIGKYEYFLSVVPFGTAAIADESYMQMFLRLAFDEVHGAQPIQIDLI